MEKHDIPLLIHGEVTMSTVIFFDRERVFVDTSLTQIVKTFPAYALWSNMLPHRSCAVCAAAGEILPQHNPTTSPV